MQRVKLRVQLRIPIAAAIVVFDYVVEARHTAVVHIWRGPRDLAQSWCFEIPVTCAGVRERAVAPRDTRIMQPLVREIRPHVAGGAVRLPAEQLQSRLFPGREGDAVAVDESIE